MKALNWFGLSAVPRRSAARDRGKLKRLAALFTRAATPVDGLDSPAREHGPDRSPEPVRWGNFR